jgi:hypothetical protein
VRAHDGAAIDVIIDQVEKALHGNDVVLLEQLYKKIKSYRIMINNILTAEFSK